MGLVLRDGGVGCLGMVPGRKLGHIIGGCCVFVVFGRNFTGLHGKWTSKRTLNLAKQGGALSSNVSERHTVRFVIICSTLFFPS